MKDEEVVFAILVHGSFEVTGPPAPPPDTAEVTVYDLGRVVFDPAGRSLNIQLWSSENPNGRVIDGPAFSPAFDG